MALLYKGDFLTDCLYDEWAGLNREHYRSLFIETSHTLLSFLILKEAYGDAETLLEKNLTIDPFDEKAAGLFADVMRKTDQNDRADAFLRQFNRRFVAEMEL